MADSKTVAANFSRHARSYEDYAQIQRHSAAKLLTMIDANINPRRIADLGCGTGILTRKLSKKFPAATIDAIDISAEMITQAKEISASVKDSQKATINWICNDINQYTAKHNYDLIISNACFQWLGKIDETIARCQNMMTVQGVLAFSAFGPQTYNELRQCIQSEPNLNGKNIQAANFTTADSINIILESCFSCVKHKHETIQYSYDSLMELLSTIKYTGTRGYGLSGHRLSRTQIQKLHDSYMQKYGAIIATNQLMYFSASQQEQ